MPYLVAKWVHVLALILWIGPALGGYIFLFRAWQADDGSDEMARRLVWAEDVCERILRIEHVAFVALIGSGLAMLALNSGLIAAGWMQQKLALVGVIIAFEAWDMWLSHSALPKAYKDVQSLRGEAGRSATRRRMMLARAAVGAGIAITAILWLAITKSGV